MPRFLILVCLLGAVAPVHAVWPHRGGAPCKNRVRDFYDIHRHSKELEFLRIQLATARDAHERAQLHFRVARAAWMADPLGNYEFVEEHLDDCLALNPLHTKAKELALVHAVRGTERGDMNALAVGLAHARELQHYPDIARSPRKLAVVRDTCLRLEAKMRGRNALDAMAHMPRRAEQNPTQFLHQTVHLMADFHEGLAEVEDSDADELEELIGESALEALEAGVVLLGDRLQALLLLGRVDEAIAEYRAIARLLNMPIDPTAVHDGTFLVNPVLEQARRFAAFRALPRLQEWSAKVQRVWSYGPADTVDWIDLLIAGHLAPSAAPARGLWRTARHAYSLNRRGRGPASQPVTDLALFYFSALLEENPN